MGLYEIMCPECRKNFMWFSGNLSQLCPECMKKLSTTPITQVDDQAPKEEAKYLTCRWVEKTEYGLRFLERSTDGYREYALDEEIAKRIIELYKNHTFRAIACKCAGVECQMTGQDLVRIAHWTLGLEW